MIKEVINSATIKFSNGVRVVNTTPHPITFLDGENIVTCGSAKELLVNAKPTEVEVAPMLVKTTFLPTEEGQASIDGIREIYPNAVIVGSIIAANAYKDVVGVCPCLGFERVPPAEKRMRTDKFNVGECW